MRRDPPNSRLTERRRDPRAVAGIIFPTGSIYMTNRTGISNVPGNVVHGVLTALSATSQEIFPEEGRSTIGSFSFTVVDLAGAVTDELREQLLVELRGVRGREVRLYTGDTDDFTDGTWQRVETYVVDGMRQDGAKYVFSCSDRKREQRVEIFDQQKTRLASTLAASDTSVVVTSTSGFNMVPHSAAYTDAPSSTVGYIKIEQTGEIIRYTGTSGGNTFTGCTRGVFNTVAQECVVDGTVGVDRRPEVVEFIYLEGSAAALDYAVKTGSVLENLVANGGGEIGTVGSLATGWTNASGNNLVVATDQSAVGARSLKITNAAAADSRNYQDVTLVGGVRYRLEGLIRTSAMPTADAGSGAFLNCDIQSGLTSFTIHEKSTVGTDVEATTPTVGISADNAAHDWTYVYCEFTPAANGTLRLGCQLGFGGSQSGIAWFDGVRVRRVDQLPSTWHMGIDEAYVDSYQYDALGADLYDPADPTAGLILRFTHLEKTDGKRFSEEQLHIPMQTFAPIDANGVIGIKRITPVLELSAPSAELTPNTVIQCDSIEHSLDDVVNRIKVNWNWNGEKYTRPDLFIHAGSIAKHKVGRVMEFNLRGLTVQRHTRETIQRIANNIFERRAAPPIRANVRLSRSLNALEVGDTQRMTLPSIRDFTAAATLDRVVEMQSRRINWLTGELQGRIFGSTERMAPDALSGSGAILSDAWYSSAGVALNTVLTMVGNAVTVSGSLAGNQDLRQAVYYHLGDLTINAGVVVTIAQNVQLRVRGTLTINGTISGVGGGVPGIVCPDVVSSAANYRPHGPQAGFFGFTLTSDGVWSSLGLPLNYFGTAQGGAVQTAPRLNLAVASGALVGIPADLRGVRGAYGPPVVSEGQLGTVIAKGGDGGSGGAGLMIVSRGTVAFGASGTINLSGSNGSAPPATGVLNGVTLYGGAGAGGSPGALYIILDGDNVTYPDLDQSFIADQGLTPQTGTPAEPGPGAQITFPAQPGTGMGAGLSGQDHWQAAHLVQYVPSAIDVGDSQDESVPAPTALTAVGSDVGAQLTWVSPPADKHDFIEVWRATTNDRTGAVRIFRGRADAFFDTSSTAVTRYFWIRAGSERLGYSAWHPTGSTSGVSATYGGATSQRPWTPVLVNVTRSGPTFTKTGGANNTWDSSVYSVEGYSQLALSFNANATTYDFVVGYDSNPSADHSWNTIDACWNLQSDGNARVIEAGSVVTSNESYSTGDRFSIVRDYGSVRYYHNGVLRRTVFITPTAGLRYLDSSFYTSNGSVSNLAFGPIEAVGTFGIDPESATVLVASQPTDATFSIGSISYSGGGTTVDYGVITSATWVNDTGEAIDVALRQSGRVQLAASDSLIGRKLAMRWTLNGGGSYSYDGTGADNANITATDFQPKSTQRTVTVGVGETITAESIIVMVIPDPTTGDPADVQYRGLSLSIEAILR